MAPAIEGLLETAELLVTGHPEAEREHAEALRHLGINVASALNTSLCLAESLCASEKNAPPENLGSLAMDCIALAIAYGTMQDAFFSYWKGYADARFPGPNVIEFIPSGGELDARLRRFSSNEDLREPAMLTFQNPLWDPNSPLAARFVDSLMKKSSLNREGGFYYEIDTDVVESVSSVHLDFLHRSMDGIPELDLGHFSLADLIKGWSVVRAACDIHRLVSILLSSKPGDFGTTVNWPALCREKREWLRWMTSVPNREAVFEGLSFNPNDKSADVVLTPIVHVGDDYFGAVPSLTLKSNVGRNAFVLLAHKFGSSYSAYSALKEARLLDSFRGKCPEHVIATTVQLPEHKGRKLPDIDLLLRGDGSIDFAVAEVKWQLSASSTRETVARNEYLKLGQAQIARIRDFFLADPEYLKKRGLTAKSMRDANVRYLLLAKGHLGSEDVLEPSGGLLADYDLFVAYLGKYGLSGALARLEAFDYLPVVGKDFRWTDEKVRFGKWEVIWKKVEPLNLPPDTETPALEELYLRAARYFA